MKRAGLGEVDAEGMERLLDAAVAARQLAYAPYSKYQVGAALLTRRGSVFIGCNVENATYGATLCAERNAVAQMIAAGEREPIACAVATGGTQPGPPCGICRQVLAEFADDLAIALVAVGANGERVRRDTTLSALFPDAFRIEPR